MNATHDHTFCRHWRKRFRDLSSRFLAFFKGNKPTLQPVRIPVNRRGRQH